MLWSHCVTGGRDCSTLFSWVQLIHLLLWCVLNTTRPHAHKSILTITNNTLQKKNTDLDDPQTQNYLSHHFADFSNEKNCFVPYYWDWTRQPMMNQSECEAVALSGRREPLVSVATGGGQLMAWTTWPLVPLVSWHIFKCCHFTTPTFPFN